MADRVPAVTVLLVEAHEGTRTLYVDALTAAGCAVYAVGPYADAVPLATTTRIDIAVLDIGVDAAGFATAEQLAALPNRPRLIAVTSRAATGAPIEIIFDRYLVKPCLPDDLVEAVRSIARSPVRNRDLLIVARERVGIYDVVQRLGDSAPRVEIRLDLRRGDRRRAPRGPEGEERRRRDRRRLNVNDQLRMDGWAFVPAVNRA
jgi:DNA-binding response OmpR family regulator